jgi:Xaa-Pro aminopeptidase
VHEGPQRISKAAFNVALEPGMILSNEPGYYKDGEYGIRIENLILVRAEGEPAKGGRQMLGFETLTLVPIDLTLVDNALMTGAEVDWLNNYHARVLDEVGPRLKEPDREWLANATRPLKKRR